MASGAVLRELQELEQQALAVYRKCMNRQHTEMRHLTLTKLVSRPRLSRSTPTSELRRERLTPKQENIAASRTKLDS